MLLTDYVTVTADPTNIKLYPLHYHLLTYSNNFFISFSGVVTWLTLVLFFSISHEVTHVVSTDHLSGLWFPLELLICKCFFHVWKGQYHYNMIKLTNVNCRLVNQFIWCCLNQPGKLTGWKQGKHSLKHSRRHSFFSSYTLNFPQVIPLPENCP